MSNKYFSPDRTMDVKLQMGTERYYYALKRCIKAGYGIKEARMLLWMYKKHYYTALCCSIGTQYEPTARY